MGAGIKKKGVSEPDSLLPFGLLESPPPGGSPCGTARALQGSCHMVALPMAIYRSVRPFYGRFRQVERAECSRFALTRSMGRGRKQDWHRFGEKLKVHGRRLK